MRRFARIAAAAALILTHATCRTAPAPAGVGDRLDALFAALHDRGLFSGAVVAGRGGAVIWQNGFGLANADAGARFTPDTPADTGSLAKTVTAALVIALHHEGVLNLDAPVRDILPELPYDAVTLRHMLSHNSGLPPDYGYFDPFVPAGEVRTTEMLLDVLAREKPPLAFVPGSAFEYNNVAFDLAALAASRATGKPLAVLLAERFFVPLGMTSAFLRPGRLDAFPPPRTLAYRQKDGQLELHDVFDLEAFHGASNIYMSALDLHRWNASFLRGAHPHAEVHEPARVGGSASGLTLGSWYASPERDAFSYAGHLQGFHAEVYRHARTGTSVVYVSNNTLAPWLQHAIVRAVNQTMNDLPVEPLVPPATEPVAASVRDSLRGTWDLPRAGELTIEGAAGGLVMLRRDGVRYRMYPVDERFFYVPGLDFMVGFGSPAAPFDRIYVASNFAEEWGTRVAEGRPARCNTY